MQASAGRRLNQMMKALGKPNKSASQPMASEGRRFLVTGDTARCLRKTNPYSPGVCRTPIEANKETTNPPKNVKLTFLIPLIHN